jgi:hypothetical protein
MGEITVLMVLQIPLHSFPPSCIPSFFIGSWWGDIRVRTWNFENSQETQLIKGMLKTLHIRLD